VVPATKSTKSSQQVVLTEKFGAQCWQLGLGIDVKPARIGAQFDAGMITVSDLTRAAG
jgi:hypothetical protein